MKRTGVLLINLGTPDAPTPEAVGRYLREFLMDGFVIDVPFPLRWFLVNVVIVPRRKHQSARLYQKIHSEQGSPLLVNTSKLALEVERVLANGTDGYVVDFAMRYGNPSIASALASLAAKDVKQIIVAPLYPQYAESSFETAIVETQRRASELGCGDLLQFLPPFYDQPAFISACAQQAVGVLNGDSSEHIVFSFHSLPERHVRRLDKTKQHCLVKPDCCNEINLLNRNCYRAQCMSTARAIANELGLSADRYTVSFQSRLGRAKWLQPVTEEVFRDLARRNIKRVAVLCPSFVADCLETLEEISLRGRKVFIDSGGEKFSLVPAVNAHPQWVKTLAGWVEEANR